MLEGALHWLGFGLCHQLPERSFFGGGIQVPVCARDTGIYVGFVVGLIVLAALSRGHRPAELPPMWVSATCIGFIFAMGVDGVSSYVGLRSTTNDIRLVTGLATGLALVVFVTPLLNGQLWRYSSADRVLGDRRDALLFFCSLPAAFVTVKWVLPLLGAAYPLVVALCIVLTFVSVNAVIVCLLPPLERRAERLRDAWLPLLLALSLAAAELVLASAVRLWLLRFVDVSG